MNRIEFAKSISILKIYNDFSGKDKLEQEPRGNVICPFHDDNNPSMKLYTEYNRFKCYGCGVFGDNIDFVINAVYQGNKNHFIDAVNLICNKYNYSGSDVRGREIQYQEAYDKKVDYTKKLGVVADKLNKILRNIDEKENYFTKRGISLEIQNAFCLGYFAKEIKFKTNINLTPYINCGLVNNKGVGLYKGRWMLPIRDEYGYVVGYVGRDPEDTDIKYLNSPDSEYFHKSELLFNYDKAKKYDTIYVVEGYMDALTLAQVGIPNVVALMGCTMSARQFDMLKDKNIILCLDNDESGMKATHKIITSHPECDFQVVNDYFYKDLNEAFIKNNPEFIYKACKNITSGISFVLFNLSTIDNSIDNKEKMWYTLSSLIGSREPEYRDKYPLNTKISPVKFKSYWDIFDKLIEGE